MYRDSTAALDIDDTDDRPSGVHAVIAPDASHLASLLESICGERGHPQSSLSQCECLCGLTRYD